MSLQDRVDANYDAIQIGGPTTLLHSWATLGRHLFNLPMVIIKVIAIAAMSTIIMIFRPRSAGLCLRAWLQALGVVFFSLVVIPIAGVIGWLRWES